MKTLAVVAMLACSPLTEAPVPKEPVVTKDSLKWIDDLSDILKDMNRQGGLAGIKVRKW